MEGDAASIPSNGAGMDRKMWAAFQRSFNQVQFLLDHNRLLINEINQNHESKIPECLTRNVVLIRELNSNIGKVVDLYSTLSSSFVKAFENSSEGDSAGTLKPDVSAAALKSPVQGQKRGRSS